VPLAVFANCSDAKVTDWATMQGHAAVWAWQTAQGRNENLEETAGS